MARTTKKEKMLTTEEKLAQALVPETEQPYKVPKNWCWVLLENVLVSIKEKEDSFDKTLKYVGLENIEKETGQIDFQSADAVKSTKNIFYKGNILYGRLRPYLNKHGIVPFGGVCSTDILVFDSKEVSSNQLVDYFFHLPFFIQYVVSNSKGINLPRVSEGIVLNAKFPLPPLKEQQRIVDRIESLFAKLDEAKEKAQSVVDGFENRKAAILHKAFTGELTAEWRRKHKKEFACYRMSLSQLCSKITDGTHHSPQNGLLGDVMYVTAKNIKERGIDLTNITFVSQDVHDEIYSRCDVKYGDVLYIKDGATTGIATVNNISEPFSLLSSVAVLRPKDDSLRSRYLSYALNSRDIKNEMLGKMTGVAITRLTLTKIKKSEIPVFPIEEQDIIIQLLDCLLDKEQQAKEAAEQVIDKIDIMKKSILARAFCGKLGTNDPTDEPAEELLKRVL